MKQAEASRITRLAPITSRNGLMISRLSAKPRKLLPSAAAIISPECSGTAGSRIASLIAPDAPVRIEKLIAAVNSASTQIQKIARLL
jgi:hypothetical protein